jgi:hypothetical protein
MDIQIMRCPVGLPAVLTYQTSDDMNTTAEIKVPSACTLLAGVSPLQTFGDVTQACCFMELISTTDNTSGNRNEFFYLLAPFHQQLLKSRLETPLMLLLTLTSLRTRTDQVCVNKEGGV